MTAMLEKAKKTGLRLLRWSERYTKTDIIYLASGGFWLTLGEVAGALATLLLAIAFAHYVSKDVYGTYRFLTAAFWTLTAFTMTGLPTAISRAIARGREGVFRSSFSYSILWSLPITFIALCISGYYFFNGNSVLGLGFVIIAVLGPLLQAGYLWSSYFVGKRKFRGLAICGTLFAFLPAAALVAVMRLNPNPVVLFFVSLFSTIAVGLLIAVYIVVKYRPNRESDNEYKKLGGHFSAMNLLATIAQQVDKLVVFHFLGGVDLAIYSFATALPEQIKNVFGGVSTLALPKFVARPFAEIRANFWNRLWLYTALLVLISIAYMAIAPFVFDLFFPAYTGAIWYSQLYALSLIPMGSALPTTLLQAHTAKRELYILSVLGPVFTIGTLIVLTSLYGLTGAVAARIAGRTLSLVLGGILVEVYALRTRLAK